MRPAEGLISQLRDTAGSLMSALYWAQKNKLDPKECWDRWPVSQAGILDDYRKLPFAQDMPSIDSRLFPVIPALKPICNILRRQTVYHIVKGKKHFEDFDKADLAAIQAAFDLKADTIWSGIRNSNVRPPFLMLNAPPLRIIAEILLHFGTVLSVYDLHECNPIAVCAHCEGLFLRTRSDGEYCSVKCRSAAWSQRKGKKYFARKQAEYRASLKALNEAKSSAPRRRRP